MNTLQEKYHKELERQLKILCSATVQAFIDTHMFMFPVAYKHKNQHTQVYLYTFYAIRQRATLSVRKLIEPAGKGNDKITIQSIVKLVTKPDFLLLSEKEKAYVSGDFDKLFNSEHTKRMKAFRDSYCHNINYEDEVMCYYKDFMHIVSTSMNILEQLYMITFRTIPTFFTEARDIAIFLSQEYWKAINNAARSANKNNEVNARLEQMLRGEF
ncbi:hypothetical protein AAIR98_001482 [Elusimicrobium simillimum]|uniref:hypothetical protein n=1 Tax=Elusimicrobium simillimum TaxID=3143438 RepID=UPI003C6EB59B